MILKITYNDKEHNIEFERMKENGGFNIITPLTDPVLKNLVRNKISEMDKRKPAKIQDRSFGRSHGLEV